MFTLSHDIMMNNFNTIYQLIYYLNKWNILILFYYIKLEKEIKEDPNYFPLI